MTRTMDWATTLPGSNGGFGDDIAGLVNPAPWPSLGLRDMKDPTLFDDPDRMSSPNYYEGPNDNGGVHWNSGVNNKAVYLMVDGGTFSGITVTPLTWDKVGAIYYEAQTNLLTSGADYSDLYYALQQACTVLVGEKGITAGDCAEVEDALNAVEMNGQPSMGYNPDAPLCTTAGTFANTVFADDLENGTANWTFNNGPYERWQHDLPYGQYAQSGSHFLYADDYPGVITDASAQLKKIAIPAGAYLWFAHAYDFQTDAGGNYDGGVLEYSTNDGATWTDAGPLMDSNYPGVVSTKYSNPLGGRQAFVGRSHGYISTRLDLSPLAGQTVSFRWRMGLDSSKYVWGWWLDNVKLFTCPSKLQVSIGGSLMGSYDLQSRNVLVKSYGGIQNGPVKVASPDNKLPLFTSERVISGNSFNEVMGYPTNQLTTEYWFPWYDNVSTATWLLVGNPTTSTAKVDIYIGGVKRTTQTIQAGGRVTPRFALQMGPVRVVSTNGVKIFSSERTLYGSNNAFNEVMGYPANQLTTEYWFPWYDNTTMDTWLLVGNPSTTSTAAVEIYIGTKKVGTYSIPKGGRVTPRLQPAGWAGAGGVDERRKDLQQRANPGRR